MAPVWLHCSVKYVIRKLNQQRRRYSNAQSQPNPQRAETSITEQGIPSQVLLNAGLILQWHGSFCFLSSVPVPSSVLGHSTLWQRSCYVPSSPLGAACKRDDITHSWEPIQNTTAMPRPPARKKASQSWCLFLWIGLVFGLLTGHRGFVAHCTECHLVQLMPCSLQSLQFTHGALLAEPKPIGDARNVTIRNERRETSPPHVLDKSSFLQATVCLQREFGCWGRRSIFDVLFPVKKLKWSTHFAPDWWFTVSTTLNETNWFSFFSSCVLARAAEQQKESMTVKPMRLSPLWFCTAAQPSFLQRGQARELSVVTQTPSQGGLWASQHQALSSVSGVALRAGAVVMLWFIPSFPTLICGFRSPAL